MLLRIRSCGRLRRITFKEEARDSTKVLIPSAPECLKWGLLTPHKSMTLLRFSLSPLLPNSNLRQQLSSLMPHMCSDLREARCLTNCLLSPTGGPSLLQPLHPLQRSHPPTTPRNPLPCDQTSPKECSPQAEPSEQEPSRK